MIRQTLVMPCDHPECPNTLTLGADEPQPKAWLCPVCEDRVLEQQIESLSTRTTQPTQEPTRHEKH